jgi:excisionase family DNA binding protein
MTGNGYILSVGKAADRLRVSKATLRRWADAGLVPSVRTDTGHRRFAPADLDELERGMAVNTRTIDNLPELSTRDELAEFTGLSVSALAHWNVRGTGPKPTRIGRSVRYRKRDVIAWLDASGRGSR